MMRKKLFFVKVKLLLKKSLKQFSIYPTLLVANFMQQEATVLLAAIVKIPVAIAFRLITTHKKNHPFRNGRYLLTHLYLFLKSLCSLHFSDLRSYLRFNFFC